MQFVDFPEFSNSVCPNFYLSNGFKNLETTDVQDFYIAKFFFGFLIIKDMMSLPFEYILDGKHKELN
jgi:hypothetical protein